MTPIINSIVMSAAASNYNAINATGDGDDNSDTLWIQCQAATRALLQDLKIRKEAIDHEEKTMGGLVGQTRKVSYGDIIKINARGTILMTRREILCVAKGTVLSYMFNGRWDEVLDKD